MKDKSDIISLCLYPDKTKDDNKLNLETMKQKHILALAEDH